MSAKRLCANASEMRAREQQNSMTWMIARRLDSVALSCQVDSWIARLLLWRGCDAQMSIKRLCANATKMRAPAQQHSMTAQVDSVPL